jgi:hypothetical protein
VSLVVKVNKPKSIYGPTLIKYCAGQQYSYQLFGDSANVSWFPSTGLSQANIPNPIIQTNTSTNYLVVNNNNGDTLHVQVIVGQTNPAQWSLAPLSASILNYTDYDTVKWYYYNEVFKRDTIAVYTYPSGVYSATYQNYPCLKYTDTVTNLPTTDLTFTDFTGRRFSTPDLGGFFEIKFSSPLQGRRLSNLYMLFPDAENALSPFNPIVTLRDSSGAIVLQDTIVIQLYGFFILQNMALPMVENMVYTLQIQVPKNVYKVLQPLQYPYIPNGGNVAITTAKFTNANNTFSFAVQPYLSISTTDRIGNEEFAAKEKITVFPNPFSQEIITDLVGNYTFELLDATGKQIMFGQYTDAQAIDTGHLPRGFYTYRIVTTTGLHSGKLVK